MYVGRSRDLASRVRSYWTDLGDRWHLRRMVEQVEWIEPVLCASEHEAAFLETDLIGRHRSRYNRALGMASLVWLRLDANPRRPSLEVVHEHTPGDGAHFFGPYLGWEPTRQAAAGVHRLYPVRLAGTHISRSDGELARSRGVAATDLPALVRSIEAVLCRKAGAVADAHVALQRLRDQAAERLMFERAASLQEQIRGLTWITEPQKLELAGAEDRDYAARARAGSVVLSVVLALRSGRLAQRHVVRNGLPGPVPAEHSLGDDEWRDQARRNAELLARLAGAEALGPVGWR